MLIPIKKYKRLVPICFIDKESLLCYRFGKILKLDLKNLNLYTLMKYPFSWKYTIISRIKFIARLFRLDVRYGIQIIPNKFIIIRNNILYEIDILKKNISSGYPLLNGSHPLNIIRIQISGFDDAYYFGEYFGNPNMDPVAIFKRIEEDKWEKVYEFQSGLIHHIHNLIPDKFHNCVWILTGDFERASAIWQANDNFKEVTLICGGEQIFRSCVAIPHSDGLLYATDTPFQKNSLRLLHKNGDKWESTFISELNGSVVYSTNISDTLIFSTIVECDGRENLLKKIFTFKRGKGIIRNECVIYQVDGNSIPVELESNKKDFLPFYLFQFGSISFPTGSNLSNYLPTYNIGLTRYDLSLTLYKMP